MRADPTSLERLETDLGRLLAIGVIASAAFLAIGLGLWLSNPQSPAALWLLHAGLLVLMAIPIMRGGVQEIISPQNQAYRFYNNASVRKLE